MCVYVRNYVAKNFLASSHHLRKRGQVVTVLRAYSKTASFGRFSRESQMMLYRVFKVGNILQTVHFKSCFSFVQNVLHYSIFLFAMFRRLQNINTKLISDTLFVRDRKVLHDSTKQKQFQIFWRALSRKIPIIIMVWQQAETLDDVCLPTSSAQSTRIEVEFK